MRAGHTAYTPLLGMRVQQSYEPQQDRGVLVVMFKNTEHSVQSEQR